MNNVISMFTRFLGKSKLLLIKNAPGIMLYGGLIVTGAGIYLLCKASMGLNDILEEHDNRVDEIQNGNGDENEKKSLIAEEKRDFVWTVVKCYGPAVTTTLSGFVMILCGYHIISARSAAITAAYKALEEGYSKYRQRVRNELGEEADRRFLAGTNDTKEIDCKGQVSKRPVKCRETASPYARFFDEFSTQWTRNPEYNLMFLNSQQNYANDKLHSVGHLFLNEVYEMLGLPHTKAGSVVGWVLNKGGDNCVDFGIYDIRDEVKRAFVNGYEPSILLDFNVDGVIYDLV